MIEIFFRTDDSFKYLWLKYVNGFDLNLHCARCLNGDYSKKVGVFLCDGESHHIVLDEHMFKYIYLCGVSMPYVWANNLHIALEEYQGNTEKVIFRGTEVVIKNARIIPIVQQTYIHRFGRLASYNTCRNWQFAYQQSLKEIGEKR